MAAKKQRISRDLGCFAVTRRPVLTNQSGKATFTITQHASIGDAIRMLKVEFARRSIVSQRRKDFRAELVLFVDWYQRSGSLARSWARVNCAFIVKLARIVTPRAAQQSSDYFIGLESRVSRVRGVWPNI